MADRLNPTIRDFSTNITGASAQILGENKLRQSLFIQNVSAVNIGINIDTSAAAIGSPGTVTLTPGQAFAAEGEFCPKNAFNAIPASGTAAVTVWEID